MSHGQRTIIFVVAMMLTAIAPLDVIGQVPFMSEVKVKLLAREAGGQFGGNTPDDSGGLLFTDFENNKINRVDLKTGVVEVVDNDSGGANGIRFDAEGGLVVMEGAAQRVTRRIDGKTEVLADSFDGKSFNAPNDLVFDSDGGFYFTDPNLFAQVQTEGVYYMSPDRQLSRIVSDLHFPNGIGLSPDETKLYVSTPTTDPFNDGGSVWEYDVLSPGKIENKELFASGFVDGLDVDAFGNVFGSSWAGVRAWDPKGNLIWRMPGNGVWHVTIHDSSAGYPNTLYLSTFFGELYKVELSPRSLGDTNEDGTVDVRDIDELCDTVASRRRRYIPTFEMDGDGQISYSDVEAFLREVGSVVGDANLDGMVDFGDFLSLSASFGKEGTWSNGDFTCDGSVDFSDFLSLSGKFGTASPRASHSVPEPSTFWLASIAIVVAPLWTRQLRCSRSSTR